MPRTYAEHIGYVDTPETVAMRAEVATLNAWWHRPMSRWRMTAFFPMSISQRRLRRHVTLLPGVTLNFDDGGRLFGSFWQTLQKARRRASLRIEGQPVAEVDFSALFIRLAYGGLGVALDAILKAHPTLEEAFGTRIGFGLMHGFVRLDFPWMDWKETPAFTDLISSREAIAAAQPFTLSKLVTTIIRQNRFCEGTLQAEFENGTLLAIARRAKVLASAR